MVSKRRAEKTELQDWGMGQFVDRRREDFKKKGHTVKMVPKRTKITFWCLCV